MKVHLLACIVVPALLAQRGEAQWTLSPKPIMTIGSDASPDYQFNRIDQLRRLSDGRVVVATGPEIRFFDAAGRFAARAGGRGSGPGEFQYISDLLVMPGDSLMTMNVRTIIVLDPRGKFVRQVQPDFTPLSSANWVTEGSVLLPNGNLLSPQNQRETRDTPHPTTLFRPVMRYSILDLASSTVTPLHTGGGYAQLYVNGRALGEPFTPSEQAAVGRDRVYVGDNDSTVVRVFDLAGKPVGVITVPYRATPVTPADLAAVKQAQLELATQNGRPTIEFEQRWAVTPKPARHPYWGTALADVTGTLWISAPPRAGNTPIDWTAFDRHGKRLATITLPARFTPKDIGANYVLGVQRDEDDVESIAMYSLNRR